MTIPVLLTAFNRPDTTARVFDTIRSYRPESLFVAIDGPRPGVPDDVKESEAVRRVVSDVDWKCEVRYLVGERNLGCGRAMVTAIDWLFAHVEEAIILEDDCVPSPDFFRYCEELLERYRNDERVWMISGTNVLGTWRATEASYHFALGFSGSGWGWATWRRAWRQADMNLAGLRSRRRVADARRTLGPKSWRYLRTQLRTTRHGWVDAWDYQWLFTCASHGGVAAYPATNLISNIGFGPHGTHTRRADARLAGLNAGRLDEPIRHPAQVAIDRDFAERWLAVEPGHMSIKARAGLLLPVPVANHVRRSYRYLRRRL